MAYPGTVEGFLGGGVDSTVELQDPPVHALVGTVRLPSNATVVGASVSVEPRLASPNLAFVHNVSAGFPSGVPSGGAELSGLGLSLAVRGGVTTFRGAALDAGIFNGTGKAGDAVVLTGQSGSYETPSISWDGASYGRLVAQLDRAMLGTIQFSIVSPAGAVLQPSVGVGDPVTVDGAANPAIRVRVALSAPTLSASPRIWEVGAGHAIAGSPTSPGATSTFAGTAALGDRIELAPSRTAFVGTTSEAIINHTNGTWYAVQLGPNSAVVVGTEIWLYIAGVPNGTTGHALGRAVSADGGNTWTMDPSPMLSPSASGWDSGGVYAPIVLWDGGTGWKMWYAGYDSAGPDFSRIGYATSTDGITWTRYGISPVITVVPATWESRSLHLGGVVKVGSTYYLYYAARNDASYRKAIGVATSSDGVVWTRFVGNPFITYLTATYTSSEAYAGGVYVHDGTFYLYWACSDLGSPAGPGYDTCLSTSTDGFTFAHDPNNPILRHGDRPWDPNGVQGLTETYDPFTGHPLWYYARPIYSPLSGDIGRAIPAMASPGSYSAVWDMGAELPRRLDSVNVAATVPAGTGVFAQFASSPDNSSFSVNETIDLGGDTSLVTVPARFLRLYLGLTTNGTAASPSFEGVRINYDRYMTSGDFVSAASDVPYPITGAAFDVGGALPPGTSVALQVSNDDGTTWEPAVSGAPYTFASQGRSFRYHLLLRGMSDAAPSIAEVKVALTMAVNPHDLVLETAGGARLAFVPGELTTAKRIPLNLSALNALLAPAAASDPPVPIDIDIFANASTPGIVRVFDLLVNLTFPDELRVGFAPDAPLTEVHEGGTQVLAVIASTTPGVVISYSWWIDGAPLSVVASTLSYMPPMGTRGAHNVRVSVTNGQFTSDHVWNFSVVPATQGGPTRPLLVAFSPVADVTIRANTSATFEANLTEPAAPPITYQWQVYPLLEGHADGGTFVVVGSVPGAYAIWVTVRNATGIEAHLWNLTVLPEAVGPGTTSNQNGSQTVTTSLPGGILVLVFAILAAAVAAVFAVLYVRERGRNREQ